MILKISPERQVTIPVQVLDSLGVGPGDRLELVEGDDGYILRPRRIIQTHVGTLYDKIKRGGGTFDLATFRETVYDPALRD